MTTIDEMIAALPSYEGTECWPILQREADKTRLALATLAMRRYFDAVDAVRSGRKKLPQAELDALFAIMDAAEADLRRVLKTL